MFYSLKILQESNNSSEVRHTNHNRRKLVNLITRTAALSNSMKLSHATWGHPRWAGHGGEVNGHEFEQVPEDDDGQGSLE